MLTTTTKEDINKMISTGKIKLSGWKLFYHYSFAGFLFLIPMLTTWQFLEYYVFDSYSGKLTPAIIARGYIILPFAIFMYFFLRSRLRLKKIDAEISHEQFKNVVKATAVELDWIIYDNKINFIRAYHHHKELIDSWSEMITIIRRGNKIYINSVFDQGISRRYLLNVFSFGWNKKNVITFINNLNKEIENSK